MAIESLRWQIIVMSMPQWNYILLKNCPEYQYTSFPLVWIAIAQYYFAMCTMRFGDGGSVSFLFELFLENCSLDSFGM